LVVSNLKVLDSIYGIMVVPHSIYESTVVPHSIYASMFVPHSIYARMVVPHSICASMVVLCFGCIWCFGNAFPMSLGALPKACGSAPHEAVETQFPHTPKWVGWPSWGLAQQKQADF
jgi:hypothetical protein